MTKRAESTYPIFLILRITRKRKTNNCVLM